jgi:RNA polymerase sigma factor (TIGR02999 family)
MANERKGHTLQATALVHEAYMRLVGDDARWDGRGHFFGAAAEAMRRILIEHARAKSAQKRGGQHERVPLLDVDPIVLPSENVDDLLALDEALNQLAEQDPAKAQLVKLIYFAGLNLDEAAAAQGISRTTAHRHWLFARAWLHDAMNAQPKQE